MTSTSAKRQPTLVKLTGLRLTAVSMPNASRSLSAEGWCSICTSMDHVKAMCPYRPADDQLGQKRPLAKPKPRSKRARPQLRSEEACRKWNRYHCMECPHRESCAYTHVCSSCTAMLPILQGVMLDM